MTTIRIRRIFRSCSVRSSWKSTTRFTGRVGRFARGFAGGTELWGSRSPSRGARCLELLYNSRQGNRPGEKGLKSTLLFDVGNPPLVPRGMCRG